MDTWWIDEPFLLGSCNPSGADLEALRRDGFGTLVSLLCEEAQPPRYDVAAATALGFERHNIPVRDFHPPTIEQLERFMGLLGATPPERKTILHCQGGIGRTGTFGAAYLIAKGVTVREAVAYIRKARRHAIETPEQERVLTEFAARLARSV